MVLPSCTHGVARLAQQLATLLHCTLPSCAFSLLQLTTGNLRCLSRYRAWTWMSSRQRSGRLWAPSETENSGE